MKTHPHHHAPRPLLVGLNGRFSGTLRPTGTQVASFHLFDAIIRGERDFSGIIFADEKFPGHRSMAHSSADAFRARALQPLAQFRLARASIERMNLFCS